jgi:hypothetical protein
LSSADTSERRLTPDNDGSDDYEAMAAGEAYELQDRSFAGGPRESENALFDEDDDVDYEDDDETSQKHATPDQSRLSIPSTVASFQLYTPDEERAIVAKFDRKLVLFVAFLYMLSFLDRSSMSCLPPERTSSLLLT